MNPFNGHTCRIVRQEQNGSQISIVRILSFSSSASIYIKIDSVRLSTYQYLRPSKSIIPSLAIPIQSPSTINLDIPSSPYPERDRFLERIIEIILLPVLNIVRELN